MVVLECERVDRSKLSTENIRRATNRRRRPSYLYKKSKKQITKNSCETKRDKSIAQRRSACINNKAIKEEEKQQQQWKERQEHVLGHGTETLYCGTLNCLRVSCSTKKKLEKEKKV